MSEVGAPKVKHPARKRSGTAKWHMSREAVDLPLADIYQMDEHACWKFFVETRFGSKDTVRCPYCGSIGKHHFRLHDKRRWKCYGCRSTFGVTTGTIFDRHKLSLRELLIGTLTWINSSAGQPALELKRHVDKTYNTAFTLQHKLREALMRGYNVGLLSGDIEIDGAHQSGFKAAEKRGVPQGSASLSPETPEEDLKAKMAGMTGTAKVKARQGRAKGFDGVQDPTYKRRYPKDRRLLISVRKRSGTKGRGAVSSRVAIALSENEIAAKAIIDDFVANSESYLNTDGETAYAKQEAPFIEHRIVNHNAQLVGPNGENCNLAEELNFRYDRAEKGMYLNVEPKYLLDYAVEVAFRSDTRKLPNGTQLRIALSAALSVGVSQYWRGFTHGKHRTDELLHPTPRPAPASGPKKGRHPISSANGRPPR
jgi:transposase-like protein